VEKMSKDILDKIAHFTLECINEILGTPLKSTETSITKIIKISNVVMRYNSYKEYPQNIPSYLLEIIKERYDRKDVTPEER
jgi:hypothetical protein